ncbi:serine/threonine protein kinase [Streptomyces sp. NPDC090032]|uniref:serine/threonine protein kinase n=1 Tax=Streptomyces sp. NPDC090032 TaxID=3365925 RepID=UPI00381BC691
MEFPPDGASWLLSDRFKITGPLGSGGMGIVHRAIDLETSAHVAVKFLAPSGPDESSVLGRLRPTPGDLKRFGRECRMHVDLGGDGVPAHVAHLLTGPSPYLVTELVDGVSLYTWLRTNRPSFAASVCVLLRLAQILDRVHACRVVHRDVKTLNILISTKGEIFLVDFGIALPLTPGATRHTDKGTRTPGSLGYMAPEIINGERNPTPAADVYGAACVFFQLVTGRTVFVPKGGEYTVEKQHCEDVAPRLSEFVPGSVPAEVDDLVARMLAKDPALRPTAREVAQILLAHVPPPDAPAPHPVLSPDPTLPRRRQDPDTAASGAPARARSRPSVRRPASGGLTRSQLRAAMASAAEEVAEGEPGVHTRQLAGLLAKAGQKWGEDDREVLSAVLLCADGDRCVGDMVTAGSRYRSVGRLTASVAEGSPVYTVALAARLGAAECRLSEDEEGETVLPVWVDVCRAVLAMGPTAPAELTERFRELGDDLAERGHETTVAAWLGRLREH